MTLFIENLESTYIESENALVLELKVRPSVLNQSKDYELLSRYTRSLFTSNLDKYKETVKDNFKDFKDTDTASKVTINTLFELVESGVCQIGYDVLEGTIIEDTVDLPDGTYNLRGAYEYNKITQACYDVLYELQSNTTEMELIDLYRILKTLKVWVIPNLISESTDPTIEE